MSAYPSSRLQFPVSVQNYSNSQLHPLAETRSQLILLLLQSSALTLHPQALLVHSVPKYSSCLTLVQCLPSLDNRLPSISSDSVGCCVLPSHKPRVEFLPHQQGEEEAIQTLVVFTFFLFRPIITTPRDFLYVLYFQPIYSGQEDGSGEKCMQNVFHDLFLVENESFYFEFFSHKESEGRGWTDKVRRQGFLKIIHLDCSETE